MEIKKRGGEPHAPRPKRAKRTHLGPKRTVVYIFEREEDKPRSGFAHRAKSWWLILECGHLVIRPQARAVDPLREFSQYMFLRVATNLAPKNCYCDRCGRGDQQTDPWPFIERLGGGMKHGDLAMKTTTEK